MKPLNDAARREADSCTADSDRDAGFPAIVARLMAAGIERYHADLRRAEKTYHDPDGGSHTVGCEPVDAAFAESFDPDGVRDAVQTIQRGGIGYLEFCARVARAGCVAYLVSLPGRRAVYYGRTGETYVEMFPGAA